LRQPRRHLRDRRDRAPGPRLGGLHHGRHGGARHRGRRQGEQSRPGLVPAHRRLRREDLRRGEDPRRLLQARRPALREGDPDLDSDIPAMLAVSAALTLSGIPFNGPIGAVRVGYVNGEYVINPTMSQLKESKLNLVVAGTEQGVMMVESEALELAEDVMLGGVVHGHEQMQAAIQAIHELAEVAGKPTWEWQVPAKNDSLIARVAELAEKDMREAFQIKQKQVRNT